MTSFNLKADAYYNEQYKPMKQYKIVFNGKRYNTKKFYDYEEARAYVRRLVTKLYGAYSDSYTEFGFRVQPC